MNVLCGLKEKKVPKAMPGTQQALRIVGIDGDDGEQVPRFLSSSPHHPWGAWHRTGAQQTVIKEGVPLLVSVKCLPTQTAQLFTKERNVFSSFKLCINFF